MKDAKRKRDQRRREFNETLEDTHQRRRYALQQRQEKALVNLKTKFEQLKTTTKRKQEQQTLDLRRGSRFNERTDKTLRDRHIKRHQRAQAKYLKDLTHKRLLQTTKQQETQRLQNPEPTEPFTIERVGFIAHNKYAMYNDSFKVVVNHPPIEVVDVIVQTLHRVVEERGLVQGDYIRLIVDHYSWKGPVSTKKTIIRGDINQLFNNIIKAILERAEYKSAPLSELELNVQSSKIPRGRGRLQPTKTNLAKKNSLILIKNKDPICLARAIVTALANINRGKWTKSQLKNGFNASQKHQATEARKLHTEAGVYPNEFGSTLEDVDIFARHLSIQINIIDGNNFNELIHTTNNHFDNGMIYLYKSNNHFDVIKSMTGFLDKSYYCHNCKKTYSRVNEHKCKSKCNACFSYGNCRSTLERSIACTDCNREFFGKACFEEHKRVHTVKRKESSVCECVQKCKHCCRTITDIDNHVCGFSKCGNCSENCKTATHKCYMLKKQTKGGLCKMTPKCDPKSNKKCNRSICFGTLRPTKAQVYICLT